MKYSKLKQIVEEQAFELKENAGYSGSWGDGGSGRLLSKLEKFKNELVVKYDFRPSEFYKLNNIEVGEPSEFSDIIYNYKVKMALEIKL